MILSSSSLQRKKLMKTLFDDVKIISFETDESFCDSKTVYENIENVALKKAMAVVKNSNIQNDIVIGCDTVCYLDNKILLKPTSYDAAFNMIKSYNNKQKEVISGVAIVTVKNGRVVDVYTTHVISKVMFRNIKNDDIHTWLKQGKYTYCSGGFMIEQVEDLFNVEIIGSYSNIIGLPLEELKQYFVDRNINVIKNIDITNKKVLKTFMY